MKTPVERLKIELEYFRNVKNDTLQSIEEALQAIDRQKRLMKEYDLEIDSLKETINLLIKSEVK